MMTGYGMGFGAFGFLLMAVFWVVIIVAALWFLAQLFPRSNPTTPSSNAPDSAISILKRRYARGEISKEEFETIRNDLEQ